MNNYLDKIYRILQTTREVVFFTAFAILFIGGDAFKWIGFLIVFTALMVMLPLGITLGKDKKVLKKRGLLNINRKEKI